MYRWFAWKYHWDANTVKNLTPDQINMYLEADQEKDDGRIHFDTIEEYEAWKAVNGG